MNFFVLFLFIVSLSQNVTSYDLSSGDRFYNESSQRHKFDVTDTHVSTALRTTMRANSFKIIGHEPIGNSTFSTAGNNIEFNVVDHTESNNVSPISFQSTAQDDLCYQLGSCGATNKSFPYCNCDFHCEYYGDCCIDYIHNQTRNQTQIFECVQESNDRKNHRGFFVISVCPSDYLNDTINAKCKDDDILEDGPPVVHDNTVIYKNMYCALCHNVTRFVAFDVHFPQVEWRNEASFNLLSKADLRTYLFNNEKYQLLPPPNTEVRGCVPRLIENNNTLCQRYINPIFQGTTDVYRNYFCIPVESEIWLRCYDKVAGGIKVKDLYPLSVIFSFRKEETRTSIQDQCKKWTEEMTETNTCSFLETIKNHRIRMKYFLTSDSNLTLEEVKNLVSVAVWSFQIPNTTEIASRYVDFLTSYNNRIIQITFKVIITKRCFVHELSALENDLKERTAFVLFRHHNKNQSSILIQEENKTSLEIDDLIFQTKKGVNYLTLISKYDTFFSYDEMDKNDKLCGKITIEITLLENGTLELNSLICANTESEVASNTSVLAILTYLTFSISVVSLTGLVIYYRKRKLTTSIAGSNLENISVSLSITNVLFMFGIGASTSERVCYAIGVVLHYLWLNVFTYMTISVIYVVDKISKMNSRTQIRDDITKKRLAITFVGLLIPLLFVVPAVLVDMFGPANLSPGYSGSVCFPDRYPANVIFFSGPVVLSLVVNVLCLVQTITQICRIRMVMFNIRKSVPYKDAQVYLRIVILSGIVWMIGVLASVLQSELLNYVFTILCGLQGFSIAVANLTTTRVQCRRKEFSTPKTEHILGEIVHN